MPKSTLATIKDIKFHISTDGLDWQNISAVSVENPKMINIGQEYLVLAEYFARRDFATYAHEFVEKYARLIGPIHGADTRGTWVIQDDPLPDEKSVRISGIQAGRSGLPAQVNQGGFGDFHAAPPISAPSALFFDFRSNIISA